MGDSGAFRFPGNLDPCAQEFVPLNPIQIRFSTQLYFPYAPSAPPSAPPSYVLTDAQVVTFVNFPPAPATATHGLQFPLTPAVAASSYFGVSPAPLLPPPSTSPTRALALSSVPCDVTESTVRRDLEVFGDVRGVQMERVLEGIVTVHFYDLRDAETSLREICGQHMLQQVRLGSLDAWGLPPVPARGLICGRAVWAQFVVPATGAVPGECNQGTLVIFNLDPSVSSTALRQIFEVYGPIRELRGTPYKKHQRFVEFYDVRDASKALEEMNGKEISGKRVVIEFSRPGGLKNKFRLSQPRPPPPPPSRLQSHSPRPPPPPQTVSHRSLVSMKKKKKHVLYSKNGNPNGSVEVSMRLLSIDQQTRGTVSGGSEGKSRNTYSAAKWGKRRLMKNMDAQFLISAETMEDSSCRDPRTTLMIKNIPNKYSQKLLLNMLDNHCIHFNEQIAERGDESQPLSSYDFVYLPIDFNNKCNVGYGFVNMTSPEAAQRLYKAFHLQRWEVFNSRKICQVTYARVQGLEALKEHFKSSKFPCEAELYLPVVFSPPRDGRQLTEPVPININGCSMHNCNHDQNDGQDYSACGSCCSNSHIDIHGDTLSDGGSSTDGSDGSGSSTDGSGSSTVYGDTAC